MLMRITTSGDALSRAVTLMLVLNCACSEKRDVVEHPPQISTNTGSPAAAFQLRTVDDIPVPHLFKGEAGECDEDAAEGHEAEEYLGYVVVEAVFGPFAA